MPICKRCGFRPHCPLPDNNELCQDFVPKKAENMTDIVKAAKKCGAYVSGVNGKINFEPEQLQAFADHYRKEGAAELKAELREKGTIVEAQLLEQLAATELVKRVIVSAATSALKEISDE